MMFKLHWNIEQFMNSMDGLSELQIHRGYSEKYKKDECLTTKFPVTLLIIFHKRENVLYSLGLSECSYYLQPVGKRNI